MFDLPSSSTFGPGGNSFNSGMGGGGGGGGGNHSGPHHNPHNRPHSTTMLGHPSSSSTSSLAGALACSSQQTNLIINYLPQDMTERELFSVFTTMGPIESCKIMRDLKVSDFFPYFFIKPTETEKSERENTQNIASNNKSLNHLNITPFTCILYYVTTMYSLFDDDDDVLMFAQCSSL